MQPDRRAGEPQTVSTGREQWRVFWTRGKFPYVFNCSRKSMEDFTRERVTRGFKVLKVRSESGDWIWEWVEGMALGNLIFLPHQEMRSPV